MLPVYRNIATKLLQAVLHQADGAATNYRGQERQNGISTMDFEIVVDGYPTRIILTIEPLSE